MKKEELIRELRDLTNKLSDLQASFQFLKDEVEEAKDAIEPYEGKDGLTEKQTYNYEWLGNLWSELDSLDENIDDAISALDDYE